MNNFVYRPYRSQSWPLVFTIPLGTLAFIGAGYCLSFSLVGGLCLIATGMVSLWLTKVIYDSLKRRVIFEQNGVRIIDGDSDCYFSWEELNYGYYIKSYKGHLFLLLSAEMLNPEEAKRIVNKGANTSRLLIDRVVVIYLDILQDVSQVKGIISNHLVRVSTY